MRFLNNLQVIFLGLVALRDFAWAYKSYKDYKIYEVVPQSGDQQLSLASLLKERDYDFLGFGRKVNSSSRILVPPEKQNALTKYLGNIKIPFKVIIDDVAAEVQRQRNDMMRRRLESARSDRLEVLQGFYTHTEINAHLDQLVKEYPSRAFVKSFGRSYEGRMLKVITVTNGDGRAGKKVIFIDAAMHAREWIAPSMALYIIEELLDNFAEHKQLLKDYDWVILPVVNADGYDYSHSEDRYWRKTRKPTNVSDCIGTDLNRNFGYHWGLEGEATSSDPCHDTYYGAQAFSEPESQVVRDIMWHYKDRLVYYLTLHSYGCYILMPWGYSELLPDNFFEMMEIADEGAMAILSATNQIYSYGSSYFVIYPTSGDSTDYALGALNIPVTMTMELPPGGAFGFEPSIPQIEEFVKETWTGVRAMAAAVVSRY